MIAIDPRGLTWDVWSARVSEDLPGSDLPDVDEANWLRFASELHDTNSALARGGAAHPTTFESWQDWALHLLNIDTDVERVLPP